MNPTGGQRAPSRENSGLRGRVLLVGADGMLGRAWEEQLQQQHVQYDAPLLDQLDLTRSESVAGHVTDRYRAVINCAAYTDVDGAESNEDLATQINGVGAGHLARCCRDAGALLVHYSTDYVFSGDATEPYRVDAIRRPINAYGRSKAVGEEQIEESGCRYLLVRTSWLYAPWGKNFVRTMTGLMRQRSTVRVVNDQRGRPTSAEHLARITWELMQHGGEGIYHVTDGGQCTWYDFAREIGLRIGSVCDVQPCDSGEIRRAAKRPMYSVLDLSKAEALSGAMPPWEQNLAAVIGRLEE